LIVHRFSWLWALLALSGVLLAGCGSRGSTPAVLFLRADAQNRAQLFRQDSADQPARQLTGTGGAEVLDFALSPDGETIIYATQTAGGTALRLISADGRDDRERLACPDAECSGAVWSHDGRRVVYERRALAGGVAGSPHLYWLDPATGETLPLIEGNDTPAYGARFSPDGGWLSYVSPRDEGIVLYQLSDGAQRLLGSRVGRPAAWSPDGEQVIVGDLTLHADPSGVPTPDSLIAQESSTVYLYRVALAETGSRQRLSPESAVDDSAPAWSPDGEWVAFGRSVPDAAFGRQLWLMRPDGSEARALTNEPVYYHGPPAWSPDGRYLLYQRYDLGDPEATTEIWRLDVMSGEAARLVTNGFLPAWLPGS
jgi:TolB protein